MWMRDEKRWMEEPELAAYIRDLKAKIPSEGEWIAQSEQCCDVVIKLPYRCNVCGFEHWDGNKFKFCPECGSRMKNCESCNN